MAVSFTRALARSESYNPRGDTSRHNEGSQHVLSAPYGDFSRTLHPLTSTTFESHKKVVPFHLLEASQSPRSVSLAWDENEAYGIPSDMRRAGSLSEQERKETLYEVYLSNVWISACIDLIAKRITSGGWELEPVGHTKVKRSLASQQNQIREFWLRVNDDDDCLQFIRSIITDLLIYGEAYAEIVLKNGVPYQIHKVDCQTITFDLDIHGRVTGYIQRLGSSNTEVPFKPEEIIRWWLPNPRAGKLALSPIERIKGPIYSDQSMAAWVQTFFKKGARPPFWIRFPGSREEANRFVIWLRENFTGEKNAHVPMVFYNGAELVEVGKGSIDIDFKSGRQMSRDEILTGYGVPLSMLGIQETAHLGAGDGTSAAKALELNVTNPIKQLVLEKLNYRIIKQGFKCDSFVFNLRYGEYRTDEIIANVNDKNLRNGSTLPNEVRQEMGKPPYAKGGDVPFLVAGKDILPLESLDTLADTDLQNKALDLETKKAQLDKIKNPPTPPPVLLHPGNVPAPAQKGRQGNLQPGNTSQQDDNEQQPAKTKQGKGKQAKESDDDRLFTRAVVSGGLLLDNK